MAMVDWKEFVKLEELNGTIVTMETILIYPMRARDVTKMALLFS